MQDILRTMFPLGTVYLLEPDRPDPELVRDLQAIADTGLGRVVLWPAVRRADDGSLDAESFHQADLALDSCARLGMDAILELIGQHASSEYLPDFLIDDAEMIAGGRDVEKAIDHWPNLCHPRVQDSIRKYFEDVVPHYRGHPALFGWDIFNETHFRSYDPSTEREFRRWLEGKYGDTASLNRSWVRHYRRFEDVRLANLAFSSSLWSSLQPVLDLHRFFAETIASWCERWHPGCAPSIRITPSSSTTLTASPSRIPPSAATTTGAPPGRRTSSGFPCTRSPGGTASLRP
jgi:beta-galactosidase